MMYTVHIHTPTHIYAHLHTPTHTEKGVIHTYTHTHLCVAVFNYQLVLKINTSFQYNPLRGELYGR